MENSLKRLLSVLIVLAVLLTFGRSLTSLTCTVAGESVGPLEVVVTISLDEEPECIAVNEQTNLVYVGVESGLKVIDGETHQTVADIPMDDKVGAVAVNPQTNRIYAAVYGDKIVVINGPTNLVVGEIPEGIYNPCEIAVNPVTNLVYLEDRSVWQDTYDKVRVYDGESLTLLASVNIPGSNEHQYMEQLGVAVNPERNRIYVTWSGDNTLFLVDGDTLEIIKSVSPSSFSKEVMVNPYTNYIYVGNTVLDGSTLEEVTNEYLGTLKAVDSDDNLLYSTDYRTVYILDGTTHSELATLELDFYAESSFNPAALNAETNMLYIINNSEKQIPVLIPEFPSWTLIMIMWSLLTVVVFIYRRRNG